MLSQFRKLARFLRAVLSGMVDMADIAVITLIRNIDGPIGERWRYIYYKRKFKNCGENVRIDTSVYIYGAQYMSIGSDVYLDKGVILVASLPDLDLSYRYIEERSCEGATATRGELVIGNEIHIAQYCMIFAYGGIRIGDKCCMSANSKLYSLTSLPWNPHDRREHVSILPYTSKSPSLIGPIELGENVWLGLNCVVMPGVAIGRDSFARSNSMILTSFPENSYVRGDPATLVGTRYK